MATYVVGDVQGCYRSLRALVEKIAPGKNDCLVFAGDVVNRGPNSLEVLRFLSEGSLSVRCVLGNHDLWALARYYLKVPPGKRDTLDPLLESPDASRLFEWLGQWPLAEAIGNGLSLHGGVHPDWTQELSLQLSSAVQKRLNGSERDGFLQRIIARNAPEWNPTLDEYERELAAVRWFTRARVCDPNGRLDAEFSGPRTLFQQVYCPGTRCRAGGRKAGVSISGIGQRMVFFVTPMWWRSIPAAFGEAN